MNAEEYSKRADKYWDEKNLDGAIADYTEAIKLEPDNPFSYCKRGMSYATKNEFDLAIADFTEAIRIEPDKFDGFYFERALAYISKGNNALAISDLEMAVKIDPQVERYREALRDIKAARNGNSSGSTGRKRKLIIMAIGFVVVGVIGFLIGGWVGFLIGAFLGIGIGPTGSFFKADFGNHLWITWDSTKMAYREEGFKVALGQLFFGFFICGIWHLIKLCFWFLISPFIAIYQLVTDKG